MTNSLLQLSGKLDPGTVALYVTVKGEAEALGIPYVVVGASARDLILHHGYGADIQRATMDIDLGIQVADWRSFQALKEALLAQGFLKVSSPHRLISPYNLPIDIIPFGGIEDPASSINWPPDGDVMMNVLGFQEACDHAAIARIQDLPMVDIRVATPAGMVLLKLIAWTDRTADLRKKDAGDLKYLFETYEKIPVVNRALYDESNLTMMETYDWDLQLAGACRLGQDTLKICSVETRDLITKLFDDDLDGLSKEQLIEEMSGQFEEIYERNTELLNAFIKGFSPD